MIPFLIGAAALVGAGKTLDAMDDMSTAKRINREAQERIDNTKARIETRRKRTDGALQQLGKTKIMILSESMKLFVDSFSRLKNVDLSELPDTERLRNFKPNTSEFLNLKNASIKASELAIGGLGSLAAGTLTAAGAYGAVGTFAAASTGTAISALSGAAATNATLAWLGGGAIAAGGGGIAAGTAMMCGLVAAPALLVGGLFLGSMAETALNDARANEEQSRQYAKESDVLCSAMDAVKDRSEQLTSLLQTWDRKLRPAVSDMVSVIEWNGVDWRRYNRQSKETVGRAAGITELLRIIIDAKVLTKDGSLSDESRRAVEQGRAALTRY